MLKNRSLSVQLASLILVSTSIIFVAAFAYNYYSSKEAVMKQVTENAKNLTLSTAGRIEVILRGVEKVPINLAGILEQYSYDQSDLIRLIQNAVAHNEEIFGSAIAFEPYGMDPESPYFSPYAYREKDIIKVTFLGGESYHYFTWDWYQIPKELSRPVWSEPYYDEGGGNIIMSTFSVPFYKESGGKRVFQGVITADVSLMWLKKMVSAVKIYETGYAFFISQNGVYFTHPDETWIMKESIFSIAEARHAPELREIGKRMVRGGEGFVPLDDPVSGKKLWMYHASLSSTGWALGVVVSEDELLAPIRTLSLKILIIGLLGLSFLTIVITTISKTVTKPVKNLDESTSLIARGDFAVSVEETGPKEIVRLAHTFNQLGRRLTEYMEKRDFIRDTFGRYVTQEVVKKLLESRDALNLGGETREVSIIMSDLRGFSALTADMEPAQVIIFLNRYLGKMIEILIGHRAIIDEIQGDGILAFFGAPEAMRDHPLQAVVCALHMQASMEEINVMNQADGLPHLEMGIAVNTGSVVVGNIGSERRTKYGLVGAQVNLTGRLESFTVGGQVLISSSTFESVRGLVDIRDSMQVEMKGFPGALTVYDVRGIGNPYNIQLKERKESMVPLPEPIAVRLHRIHNKVIRKMIEAAWIIQFSETSAVIQTEGELRQWENVRLDLLDPKRDEMQGRIYGKAISVKPLTDNLHEAVIRFTSVSPGTFQIIQDASSS
jgi:sigma-B regulation protein RsbU (phosphoserine phosphatase)